jgi:hypothetical protein
MRRHTPAVSIAVSSAHDHVVHAADGGTARISPEGMSFGIQTLVVGHEQPEINNCLLSALLPGDYAFLRTIEN